MKNTEKIRYGIIGLKGYGKTHIASVLKNPQAELTAIVDKDTEYAKEISKKLKVPYFRHYKDLLEKDIVDAVSIALPHHLHAEVGIDCLKAGVHIYTEKPMANRVSESDTMLKIAQEKHLKIAVGHQYRLHRSSTILKEIIDDQTLGHLMRILWTWMDFRPESYYRRDPWRTLMQHAGGGVLMNQASHDIDLICWLFGLPEEIYANSANYLHDTELEDYSSIMAQFPGGASGSFQFSINQANTQNVRQIAGDQGIVLFNKVRSIIGDFDDEMMLGIYEKSLNDCADDFTWHHTQPQIQWQKLTLPPKNRSFLDRAVSKIDRTLFDRRFQLEEIALASNLINPMPLTAQEKMMNSFIDAIKFDKQPFCDGKSAANTVEFINATVLSSIKRKPVTLPIDRQEYDELFNDIVKQKYRFKKVRY